MVEQKSIRQERQFVKVQDPIVELMQLLQSVQIPTPEAKMNETTMSDNNGGRIKY